MIYSNWLREKSHNAIKFGEAEGNPCALKYSKGKNLKNYQIYGNSTQETRSGKNLLKNTASTQKINGVTFTVYSMKRVNINGTNNSDTDDIVFDIGYFEPDKNSIYTFSGIPDGSESTYYLSIFFLKDTECVEEYHVTNSNGLSIDMSQITSDFTNCKVSIVVKAGQTISSKNFGPQIELGTEKTSYEQYGAMPSPEYPSEIKSVGSLVTDTSSEYYGKYCIPITVIKGKNLLDLKNITIWKKQRTPLSAHDTQYYQIRLHEIFPVGTTLTFHWDYSESIPPWFYFQNNDNSIPHNSETITYFTTNSVFRKSLTFTIRDGYSYSFYPASSSISLNASNFQEWLDKFTYMQIKLGTAQSEYEPYSAEVTNIYLDEPLRGLGDYRDYIDYRNKKVVRYIQKNILDGTENWRMEPVNGKEYNNFYVVTNPVAMAKTDILSNKITGSHRVSTRAENNGFISFSTKLNITHLTDTVDNWKTLLSTWYTNGNPMIINYILATPIEEPIDNLPDIIINNSETCIIRTDTQIQASNIKVKYIRL